MSRTNRPLNRDDVARVAVHQAMSRSIFRVMRIAPLRPVDRVVAGYATLAFALAAAEALVTREWLVAAASVLLSAFGVMLLRHDHRRSRTDD
jgi:hypothetical protein